MSSTENPLYAEVGSNMLPPSRRPRPPLRSSAPAASLSRDAADSALHEDAVRIGPHVLAGREHDAGHHDRFVDHSHAVLRALARVGAQRLDAERQLRQGDAIAHRAVHRSEEHTSELQSLMRISYAVFCLK